MYRCTHAQVLGVALRCHAMDEPTVLFTATNLPLVRARAIEPLVLRLTAHW